MKAIHTWYMKLNLRKKLIYPIYASMCVLLCLVSAVLLSISNKRLRQEVCETYQLAAHQAALSLRSLQSNCKKLSDFYAVSPNIQEMLQNANKGQQVRMPDDTMRLMLTYPNIISVVFYRLDGSVVDYVAADGSYEPLAQTAVDRPVQELLHGDANLQWEFIDANSGCFMLRDKTAKLCLWRTIKNPNDYTAIGVVAISADISSLSPEIDSDTDAGIWICVNGHLVTSRVSEPLTNLWSTVSALELQGEVGSISIQYEKKDYELVYEQSTQENWSVEIVYPQVRVTQSGSEWLTYLLLIFLALLVLVIPLLVITFQILIRPLRKLTCSLMQFAKGDIHAAVSFHGQDEIAILGHVFNDMVAESRQQIETIYLLQLEEQKAELETLQSQINPHFLYNVLDTIHWSALQHGSKDAAEMAYSLGQFFRLSLHRGERMIPLSDEKKLIEYYLKLQKMRYQARLLYHLEFEDAAMELILPKLLLQPLVENAVVHGVGKCPHPVTVSVTAQIQAENLYLHVLDDGCGMPEAILQQITADEMIKKAQGESSYALYNIRKRLQLSFGGQACMEIQSTLNVGTSVQIRIPISFCTADAIMKKAEERHETI